MKVWRIVRPAYAANPLSGVGAALAGNRWNSVGIRMGYSSTSRPLAVLEMLVHLTRNNTAPDAVLVPLEIPDELVTELHDLPTGWDEYPYAEGARHAGDRWAKSGNSLGLLVPSAVLTAERNLLINPAHPQIGKVRVGRPEIRAFDKRLYGFK